MHLMTPRERVMTALKGGVPDKIPFTAYENKIPRCNVERELRNRGLCIVRRVQSYTLHRPNVGEKSEIYVDGQGRTVKKTVYSTPVGELTKVVLPVGFTDWTLEYEFKSPDDYKTLLFMIKDTVIKPNYESIVKEAAGLGPDFVVRDWISAEPLQNLILFHMGLETFSYEWMENRDEVLKLYNAFVELAREIYPVVADGPLKFANYGGNVMPDVTGGRTFRDYYIPNYNEAAEVLHKKGKLIGCHMDADNTSIMDDIGSTDLDYIEAYDPGMSPPVSEALKKWPKKVLWINWPSAWHLRPIGEAYSSTIELLKQSRQGGGIIVGITEDVPEDRWKGNYNAIMNAIDDYHSCGSHHPSSALTQVE